MPDPQVALPLVYSCSGASSCAQLANHLAVELDHQRIADMSCIAGVGGDVKSLVRLATSGRSIVAIDGCPLRCVKKSLGRHDVQPSLHVTLTDLGVSKQLHTPFDPEQAERLLEQLLPGVRRLAQPLGAGVE